MLNLFQKIHESSSQINLLSLHDAMCLKACTDWGIDVGNVNKLRTYITFKKDFCTEKYVNIVTNRQHGSALA